MKIANKWSRKELLNSLDEFKKLYEDRPIKDNSGGMTSSHMLASWFIVKTMKPKYIIESGVWKGLGTWLFEKASPDTKIISIDPAPHFRVYTSPNATYQTEDFLDTDWSHLPKDDTLLFFDDHQNFLTRLKRAHELGFKHVIDEDNYPKQQGDCYSPKKILANERWVIDLAGSRTWYDKVDEDNEYFKNNVSVYQEMPPIFKGEVTRWGDLWDDDYPTPEPLLKLEDSIKYSTFFGEKFDYTWICYLELK
tara:strand:+ start:7117 stop:7866 length:750 start_codon:yes stop_codon:yes gene_type:complete